MTDTLSIFASLNFSEGGNTFVDDANTDNDVPYYLFPTTNAKNGGYASHGNDANKYVVDTGAYGFYSSLKAAALLLNKTDAIDPKDVAEYRREFAEAGVEMLTMSAATGEGTDRVLEKLWTYLTA